MNNSTESTHEGTELKAKIHLLEKRRLDSQVFGDHIEAEEMPVDARTGHGQLVEILVFLSSFTQQRDALFPALTNTTSPAI